MLIIFYRDDVASACWRWRCGPGPGPGKAHSLCGWRQEGDPPCAHSIQASSRRCDVRYHDLPRHGWWIRTQSRIKTT